MHKEREKEMSGFIKLYREIDKSWIWKEKPFSKGQAWVDLIMLANYTEKKTPYKGKIITCERGVVNVSLSVLASRWGWGRERVKRFLLLLECDEMVTTNITKHRTTITIENYAKFQDVPTTNEQPIIQPTSNQRATNEQPTSITKNIKKDKKDKNIYIYAGDFQNVKLSEGEYQKLQERFPYDYQERINSLSLYIKSKGDKYKSHYATILNWSKKETVQDLSPEAKQKRLEAIRKKREAEQQAEDEREREEWYREKMKQYGVKTRVELDKLLAEQQAVTKEKLKNIASLF